MELDDLKAGWQQENTDKTFLKPKNMEQLEMILKSKTTGIMELVKSKYQLGVSVILFGIIVNILLSPFLHWLLGEPGPIFRIPTANQFFSLITIVLFFLVAISFYWIKFTSVSTHADGENIKEMLLKNIQQLKKSWKQEVAFILLFFIVLFLTARTESHFLGKGSFWDIYRVDILLSLLAGVSVIIGIIKFRSLHYNKNINELKSLLSEYNEASEEDQEGSI